MQAGSGQSDMPFILLTDRQLYITGESISFALMTARENTDENFAGETIIYIELITADGRKIAGEKFLKTDRTLWASFQIPEELISGNYYLRGYSRYLRNYGVEWFASAQIKLVNPRTSSVMRSEIPVMASSLDSRFEKLGTAELNLIRSDKTTYKRRETVSIHLDSAGMRLLGIEDWFISVIPAGTLYPDSVNFRLANSLIGLPLKESEIIFENEDRSIVLTGEIDCSGNRGNAGRVVAMSIIGENDFSTVQTGPDGRFLFSLPILLGKRDIYLVVDGKDQESIKMRIENDFDTRPVALPSNPFHLNDRERKVLLQMWKNVEIADNYTMNDEKKGSADTLSSPLMPFYHIPDKILEIDRYVQLPTLGEYFNELPMDVKVRERQGLRYFRFTSAEGEMLVHEPLVLVDGLYAPEIEKVLAISPQKVAYIHMINRSYVKGDKTYGGIIHIVSKSGDFAGMDLPASGVFIHYGFPAAQELKADTLTVGSQLPDARNTLYWYTGSGNPYLHTFTTADTQGDYHIVLTGICKNGRQLVSHMLIHVIP